MCKSRLRWGGVGKEYVGNEEHRVALHLYRKLCFLSTVSPQSAFRQDLFLQFVCHTTRRHFHRKLVLSRSFLKMDLRCLADPQNRLSIQPNVQWDSLIRFSLLIWTFSRKDYLSFSRQLTTFYFHQQLGCFRVDLLCISVGLPYTAELTPLMLH